MANNYTTCNLDFYRYLNDQFGQQPLIKGLPRFPFKTFNVNGLTKMTCRNSNLRRLTDFMHLNTILRLTY